MEHINLELKAKANNYPSFQLSDRHLCDLELIMNGGFKPLSGFMTEKSYSSVLNNMRLDGGELWPIPITLDVSNDFISKISNSRKITLRNKEGFALAILEIEDMWQPDFEIEAKAVFGTKDIKHPGVNYLMKTSKPNYIGGKIKNIGRPNHYDYNKYRHSPDELKSVFKNKKWDKIIAFQTRNPLHKAHFELTIRAMEELKANLLIHPVVGMTKPGDVNHYTRVRCYKHIMSEYSENSAFLSLLPLAMRMGGTKRNTSTCNNKKELRLHALNCRKRSCWTRFRFKR